MLSKGCVRLICKSLGTTAGFSGKENGADSVCLDFSKLPLGKLYVKIWINRRTAELIRKWQERKQIVLKGEILDQRVFYTPKICKIFVLKTLPQILRMCL